MQTKSLSTYLRKILLVFHLARERETEREKRWKMLKVLKQVSVQIKGRMGVNAESSELQTGHAV